METIGDGYLCVSGLPRRNGDAHATEIADLALSLLYFVLDAILSTEITSRKCVAEFRIAHLPGERVQMRAGAASGMCL